MPFSIMKISLNHQLGKWKKIIHYSKKSSINLHFIRVYLIPLPPYSQVIFSPSTVRDLKNESCAFAKLFRCKKSLASVILFFSLCFNSPLGFILIREHSSITSSKRWVGGVRKWQFLMVYITANHQRGGWMGKKK